MKNSVFVFQFYWWALLCFAMPFRLLCLQSSMPIYLLWGLLYRQVLKLRLTLFRGRVSFYSTLTLVFNAKVKRTTCLNFGNLFCNGVAIEVARSCENIARSHLLTIFVASLNICSNKGVSERVERVVIGILNVFWITKILCLFFQFLGWLLGSVYSRGSS